MDNPGRSDIDIYIKIDDFFSFVIKVKGSINVCACMCAHGDLADIY
ncbi:hypothetical protein B4113_1517 [Geobacillus sp. B4113_201601]|nr:hypothetical protein B4113_1517 [Geobacillus sp. B4113_201601]